MEDQEDTEVKKKAKETEKQQKRFSIAIFPNCLVFAIFLSYPVRIRNGCNLVFTEKCDKTKLQKEK